MKKLAFFAFVYFLTINLSFGQTKQIKPARKTILVEDQTANPVVSSKPASESLYFGYDQKIKEYSLTGEIPLGFPTKEGYTKKEEYLKAINKWLTDNQSFVKPQYKNAVITN